MEKLGYQTQVPELPTAWQPDIERYWSFLKDFDFNEETLIIGHSSGAAAIFGLLNKLPDDRKIKLAISVAGFHKDEGWNCTGLFKEKLNWQKIKNQAGKIFIIYSDDDPYVRPYQTEFLSGKLDIEPILMKKKKHFNLEAGKEFDRFPELLELIKRNI